MDSKLKRTAVALAIASALALPGVAGAQTDKEQALEARVAELEKIVQQLLAEKQAAPAPAPAAAVAAAPAPAKPANPIQDTSVVPNALGGTKFFITGFGKLDVLYTETDDGQMAQATNIGRDFYVPSLTPVGATPSTATTSGTYLNSHIKQTRVMMGTDSVVNDHKLGFRLEFDLYGQATGQGDERISNTYGLSMRHAYITYDKWLFGQTWSNYMDVAALSDTVDFIGNTDGTAFVRQGQVRWTSGGLSISAENPYLTYNAFGVNARSTSDDGRMPDLTAAYQFKVGKGHIRASVLGRELRYDTGTIDDSSYSVAGSLTGKFVLGDNDDVRFTLYGGEGIGRYVGLNFQNDASLNASGDLEAISGYAGSLAWRHVFSPKFRTNIIWAMQDYDVDGALTGGTTATEFKSQALMQSMSWAINGFYTPVPKLDLGLEYRFAEAERDNGADGSMNRLQFTTKYSF